jgi:hypothetical protein
MSSTGSIHRLPLSVCVPCTGGGVLLNGKEVKEEAGEMVNGRSGGPFVNDQNARLFLCLCTDTDGRIGRKMTDREAVGSL